MKMFKKFSLVTMICFSLIFGLSIQNISAAGPSGINLGTADDFVILAKTGVSTTGASSIVGDIGVSPVAATAITGFGLILPAMGSFSTSSLVTGKVYAPGYADPTPANLTTAVGDMETAYTDGMGRTNPTATELGAGNIGGLTLAPGLYKWGTGVTIPTDVTFSGSANDVWIFQIAQNLNISSAAEVLLSGGAKSSNIFWVVAGQATLGTTSVFNGNILSQTAIVLNTGATLNGRALAQTAVTLDSNSVVIPSGSSSNSNSDPDNDSDSDNDNDSNPDSNSDSDSSSDDESSNLNSVIVCSPGQMFRASDGARCTSSSNLVFCPPGQMFKATTGERCNATITTGAPGASGYNFGNSTLKNGSKGEAVKELQRFLNSKLNLGLIVDGKLGPKTIVVIKKWQAANGLVVDGLIGAKTKAKMNASVQ